MYFELEREESERELQERDRKQLTNRLYKEYIENLRIIENKLLKNGK